MQVMFTIKKSWYMLFYVFYLDPFVDLLADEELFKGGKREKRLWNRKLFEGFLESLPSM